MKGRPPTLRRKVLAIVEPAAVLGVSLTYGAMARQCGTDWRNVRRVCREINWPGDFQPVLQADNLL